MSNSTQNKFRDFVESPDAELMLKVAKSSQKKMDDMVKDVKQDTQNDWVKRFNDEFPCLMHFRPNKRSYGYSEVGNDVKAFIAKLLADARKEGHELGRAESVEFEVDRARKEVIERIDQDIRTTMDPYEYKGKITAQQAKKQTLMMVRQILRATQKEETL